MATGYRYVLGACALVLTLPLAASAQPIPAFSGADGAAGYVTGGRGGIVYHVTKLNSAIDDPLRNDPGTIRYGLNNANFPSGVPRTIVFDVGGVFHLGRLPQVGWDPNGNGWDAQSRLTIGGTNVTLAGQTAPGAGVIFMGGGLKPQGNNNIIRNITMASGYGLTGWWSPGNAMRAAPGTPEAGTDAAQWFPDNVVYDGMDIAGTNIMIDHVSTLFATDETISMNEVADNITVQYSNISQGLNYPQWDAEGGGLTGHALGSLLTAGNTTPAAISFHHNLYAHQKGRLPQVGNGGAGAGAYYDFRNNVFYNWFGTAGSRSGATFLNLVNNFYLAGDGGDNPAGGSNPAINQSSGGTGVLSGGTSVHRTGNLLDSNKDADPNDGAALSAGGAASPFWRSGAVTYNGTTDAARTAFDRVLGYVGANWWTRDAVVNTPDERIISEAQTGTGKVIAWADDPWNNSPTEGAEWQALKNTPQTTRALDFDTEASIGYGVGDGMPTSWELQHGLNPNARDDAGDFDADGYTNLEEYLNDIAAWPAPNPLVFNNAHADGRYAHVLNWDANPSATSTHPWQPSRFDTAHVESGVVTVDAVGQHAGVLSIGPGAGQTARVDITGGWLRAHQQVAIGAHATASGELRLTGGELFTPLLTRGAGDTFSFTGGELHADMVAFDLTNNGGTLAPGAQAEGLTLGTTAVDGALVLASGEVEVELAGDTLFDAVLVNGPATLGGALRVELLGGYTPDATDAWPILMATGGITGSFTSITPGYAVEQMGGTLLLVVAPPVLPGDFNEDGQVDAADYVVWRDGGAPTTGEPGYTEWRDHFGATASAASQSAPEPTAAGLAALAALAIGSRRRRG